MWGNGRFASREGHCHPIGGDLNDWLRKRLHEENGAEIQPASIHLAEMVAVCWSIGGAAYIDIFVYLHIDILSYLYMSLYAYIQMTIEPQPIRNVV